MATKTPRRRQGQGEEETEVLTPTSSARLTDFKKSLLEEHKVKKKPITASEAREIISTEIKTLVKANAEEMTKVQKKIRLYEKTDKSSMAAISKKIDRMAEQVTEIQNRLDALEASGASASALDPPSAKKRRLSNVMSVSTDSQPYRNLFPPEKFKT